MKEKILHIIKKPQTKYIVIFILFLFLIMFSKDKNIFYYNNIHKQKKELEKRKNYYLNEIKKDSINTLRILNNLSEAEKFGREKYLMKRDNEDIFIIRKSDDSLIKNTIQ